MKKIFVLLIFIAGYLQLQTLSAAETFHLGYSDFKPFIWKEGDTDKGIFVDVLKEALEKRMGIPVAFHVFPAKRLVLKLKNGVVDGFVEVATPERLKIYKTGRVPVAMGMVGAFTYRNHPRSADLADADTLEELQNYKVLSYIGDEWGKEFLTSFDVDNGAKDLRATLKKLKMERGDLVLQLEQVANYNIQQLHFQDALVQLPNIALDPIFYQLLIREKSTFVGVLSTLDSVLTAMLNDGTIDRIYKKFRGVTPVEKIVSNRRPKIKFMHYATGIMPRVINDVADAFNSMQNQYRLKPIHLQMENYKQAIKVLLVGGLPADMIMTWAGYRTQYLVDLGFIEPIDDIWKSAKLDEAFPSSTAAGMTYNGKKYCIPLTHHILPFFYNKKIFWENDIEIPKTWDDLLKAGEKLKANGIIPFALGAKERWPAQFWFDYLLVRTAGHEYRRRLLAGNASFTDPEVKKAFVLWKQLLESGYFNRDCVDIDFEDASKMVYEGKAAMTLNGTWTASDFKNVFHWQPIIDFDIFPFPIIDPDVSDVVIGVMDVILPTQEGKVEASKKAILHFSNADMQMYYSGYSGSLPPNKKISVDVLPPFLAKISEIVQKVPHEIFPFDLSTEPRVAEIGLSSFKEFLIKPDQYIKILEDTDYKIRKVREKQ